MKNGLRVFLVVIGLAVVATVIVVASAMRMLTPEQVASGLRFLRDLVLFAVAGELGLRLLGTVLRWSRQAPTPVSPQQGRAVVPREPFKVNHEPQTGGRVVV